MPSSAVNICVLTLVLLSIQHTCHSRPHAISKRAIIKDYFNPYIVNPEEFERGEDGKFYLKKSAHRSDSAVNYAVPENTEEKNVILQNDMKAAEMETRKAETEAVEDQKTEPLEKMVTAEEDSKKVEVPPMSPLVKETQFVKELVLPKSEAIEEEKIDFSKEKAPFTPVDHELTVPPKPNSKDEVPIKTDLTPIAEEEKVDQKVSIGQVPRLYHKVIPVPTTFRIPILIPIRQVSYRTMSILPLPPAEVSDRLPFKPADASDRLPLMLDDDIVGEGEHESAALEGLSESAAEDKKEGIYPVAIGVRLPPMLSFSGLLEDLKDADKQDSEKQTKIVDVLGKKFLMQSNIMKYPSGDNSHTIVRFMSVKPLENVDAEKEKEAAVEEAIKKVVEDVKRQEAESKERELMAKEDDILKVDEKEKGLMFGEGEILKSGDKKKELMFEEDKILKSGDKKKELMFEEGEISKSGESKKELMFEEGEISKSGESKKELMFKEGEILKENEKKKELTSEEEILEAGENKLIGEGLKKEIEMERVKEHEILKAEETQINVQVDPNVPKEIATKEDSMPEINLEKSEQSRLKEAVKEVIHEAKVKEMKKSFIEEFQPFDKKEETAGKSLYAESEMNILESDSKEEESEEEDSKEEDSKEENINEEKAMEESAFAQESKEKLEIDALTKKDMDDVSKEEFFFIENQKKGMTSEEVKPKKKTNKKKKKCKCEEKYSDSEDDDE